MGPLSVQIICGVFGVVITAVYMLRFVRGTFFGEPERCFAHVHDAATPFARLPYVVLISVLLVVGCWPGPMLRLIDTASQPLIQRLAPFSPPAGQFADTTTP